MSRIEAGRATLTVEPFDLARLLDETRQMFAPLTIAKGNHLSYATGDNAPAAVIGDVGKVRQVLINLLSNANKFTERGKIEVKTASSGSTDGRVMIAIAVRDTGRGIAKADLPRLFTAFEQTESGMRAGGTGLGLAISRNFARMMGGDLTVQSDLGQGSQFTFSFQAELAPEGSAPQAYAQGANLRLEGSHLGLKALIVDDIATNRDVLADLLTRTGFEVRQSDNAEEGIGIHDAWKPALVLMDLRMPGMGGIEAIRRLRAAGSDAVLVALTASSVPESRGHALKAGANELILKPCHEMELLHQLGKLLGVSYVSLGGSFKAAPCDEAPGIPLRELLKNTSPQWRASLREAALEARAGRIRALASQLAADEPSARQRILSLLEDFQYDAIIEALETDPNL